MLKIEFWEAKLSEDGKIVDMNLDHAASIVAAYVSNNSLRAADLPELISAVHTSICQLSRGQAPAAAPTADTPAVPIKKSVTKDYIICLEDGKKFKSLRRHLSTYHDLTPEQYRAKWGLPSDHPMVAPSYSATRSQLAKDSGLGLVSREADAASLKSKAAPSKAGRGRPRKAV